MPNIENWLIARGYPDLVRSVSVGGGSISSASQLLLADGSQLFAKTNPRVPEDFFRAEAQGLNNLREHTALRIPEIIHVDRDFILLEDLGAGLMTSRYWQMLAEGLAQLHKTKTEKFGLATDNYCGSTPQTNTENSDGFQFFAEHRILGLARQAEQRGLLTLQDMTDLGYVADNLRRWIPQQPAALIHGDLWSGNVHCDGEGNPALVDPAIYWGWTEAELAMTTLFGGFPKTFYDHYLQVSDMDKHWHERAALYNLYHLLNHLLLFGSSYAGQIRASLRAFV